MKPFPLVGITSLHGHYIRGSSLKIVLISLTHIRKTAVTIIFWICLYFRPLIQRKTLKNFTWKINKRKKKKRTKKTILFQRELNSRTSCSQSKSFDNILFDKTDCKEINLSTALHSEPQNVHVKRILLQSFSQLYWAEIRAQNQVFKWKNFNLCLNVIIQPFHQ